MDYLLSLCMCYYFHIVFFFKQKTAYEMRISDWSSDVCSSDLLTCENERKSIRCHFAEWTIERLTPLTHQPPKHLQLFVANREIFANALKLRLLLFCALREGMPDCTFRKHYSLDRKSKRLNSSH